jgi:hypothetical protein
MMKISKSIGMVPAALALATSLLLLGCHSPKPVVTGKEPLKILFIGDSFTFCNDGVYNQVKQLAATARIPRAIIVDSETQGGATLKILSGKTTVHDKIRLGFDIVVMQDDIPEFTEHTLTPFYEHATAFDREIRATGAKPVLFMAWAYERLNWVKLDQIVRAHRDLGGTLHIPVAPVGLAFERSLARRPAMAMLGPDKEHESIHGTYLAANVIYATLLGTSPEGCAYHPSAITSEEAVYLQRLAWETVCDWQKGR